MSLAVHHLVVGPFQENSYVVGDGERGEAILVDPGGEVPELERLCQHAGLRPKVIVNTHAHIDHIAGVQEAKRRFGIPFHLHPGDADWLQALPMQAEMFHLEEASTPEVEHWLKDGESFQVGGFECRVIHTPGHTPGGCCLFFAQAKVLLTGDTLFVGSIGRTDFPGGSFPEIHSSIQGKLFPLGDDIIFYPGHGPEGSLGNERRTNPFVGMGPEGKGRPRFV